MCLGSQVSATPQELVSQYHICPRLTHIHINYHAHHVWHVLHSTKLMKYRCSTCWFVQSLNYLTSRHAGRRRRWRPCAAAEDGYVCTLPDTPHGNVYSHTSCYGKTRLSLSIVSGVAEVEKGFILERSMKRHF